MTSSSAKSGANPDPAKHVGRSYLVTGMDCPSCALSLEKGLHTLRGVSNVSVNPTTRKLTVVGDAAEDEIVERVRALGYDIEQAQAEGEARSGSFWGYLRSRSDARLFLIGFFFILPGVILEELLGIQHAMINISSLVAMAAAGYPVFRSAWGSLRLSREININVLMSIAAAGAVIIGAYTEAGMVMVLFLLGEILEGYAAERSRRQIRSLMELAPREATRVSIEDGRMLHQRVSVEHIQAGDRILVKPGENIPMDGVVLSGVSHVNQASITGESQPVEKFAGAQVFASSINGKGSLEIEVSHLAADNTISRLIRLVEQAQEKRAPAQRFVDRFARYYTPLVVGAAILVVLVPTIFFHQPLFNPDENTYGWLYRGLALLVVGCPCALVISTPVSIISAISNAARHGVLVKGGAHLEELSRIRLVAIDKTGTLTRGQLSVVSVRSSGCQFTARNAPNRSASGNVDDADHLAECEPCSELVAIAGALERYSEHPLAGAVVEAAEQHDLLDRYRAEDVSALAGRGVTGRVNGWRVTVGSHKYFDEQYPHFQEYCQQASLDAEHGITPLMVSQNGAYIGTISVADGLRESGRAAVGELRKNGVKKIVMLTGDETEVARGITREVQVDDFRAQLLPEEKLNAVLDLRRTHGRIAMIGDGINDAPSLAAADVGIALGGANGGSAQAMETADVTLMTDDLRRLGFLFKLSQATMRTIYFNVSLAISIKLIFFVLVLLGLGSMWMAVFADMGISLLVTAIGLRLLRHPTALTG